MKLPIYLDYAATTPVDPRVAAEMIKYLTIDGIFGNASSRSHRFGWQAAEAVDIARTHIANLINVDFREIIFTSGATESNNLAIKGVMNFYQKNHAHIITCITEHKSVLDTCNYLKRTGFNISYLTPDTNGKIDIKQLCQELRKDTLLVSIMHVNNEIGTIQDIATIGEICYEKKIIFHVDATQSIGKVPIDLKQLKIDLMSFSAHKIYGPKGIGGLYVRRQPNICLEAQIHGGGHQYGVRSGTLPVHQIVGMGEAYRIAKEEMYTDMVSLAKLRNRLWFGLSNSIEHVYLNGSLEHGASHILNIRFQYVDSELLIIALKDLAISTGSACNSGNMQSSYVLRAIGLNDAEAYNSIRLSLGRFTSEAEIDYAVEVIKTSIVRLHKLSFK